MLMQHETVVLMLLLAVKALHNEHVADDSQTTDSVCTHHPENFAAGLGQHGYLKVAKNFSVHMDKLLSSNNLLQCHKNVSPNCVQCQGETSVLCNSTTEEDISYLKSIEPIPYLRLRMANIEETSWKLYDGLDVSSLELQEGNLTLPVLSMLSGIRNLSTLVIRGPLQMIDNITDYFTNMQNLTTLILDIGSNSKGKTPQDGPRIPKKPGGNGDPGGPDQNDPGKPDYEGGNNPVPQKSNVPDAPNSPLNTGIWTQDDETSGNTVEDVDTHQSRGMDSLKDSIYAVNKEQLDKTSIFPKLQVYGVASGTTKKEDHEWILSSPIEYLYFHGCGIYMDSMKEILVGLKHSLLFLDIHNSFIDDGAARGAGDNIYSDLRELICTIKDSTNRTKLRGFAAANMGLKDLPSDALEILKDSLQYLSLYGNDFSQLRVEPNISVNDTSGNTDKSVLVFPTMNKLLELDLTNCNMHSLESDVFANLPNLQVLILAQNHFVNLHADSFRSLSDLRLLDISLNDNSGTQTGIENINFTNTPSLEILDVSETKLFRNFKFLGEFRSLKMLSMCSAFESLSDIGKGIFETMTNLEILDLSGNSAMDGTIGQDYFYGLESLKKLYLVRCFLSSLGTFNSSNEMNPFQHLKSLTFLDVSQNQILLLEEHVPSTLEKLEVLVLMNNNIGNWIAPHFTNLTFLRKVNLENNVLTSMSDGMIQDFSNLQQLSILGNHFKCDCGIIDFVRMANGRTVNGSSFLEGWLEKQNFCIEESNSVTLPFQKYTNDDCGNKNEPSNALVISSSHYFVIYFAVAVFILILTLITVVAYFKWPDIRFFAIILKNAAILSFSSDESDSEKKSALYNYDVFISYSDPNRNWVLEELIPNLEMKSNLKVCLHERDFKVGLSILENIISCMDQSKYIMLIISLPYIKSNWCQFELHLAQHRLLETKRENLILVLLEDIPRSKRSKMLSYLMKTKTYIVWPSSDVDKEARKYFWKRIHQAVALQQNTYNQTISLA